MGLYHARELFRLIWRPLIMAIVILTLFHLVNP